MADNNTKIIVGHALDVLKTLPSESVDCVVTSPPYWGLRDYHTEPLVWDGDADCEHEWGIEKRKVVQPNRDSKGGGVVLDPFGGSGTTAAVAKQLGRNSIMIELNPNYIPLMEERVGESDVKIVDMLELEG